MPHTRSNGVNGYSAEDHTNLPAMHKHDRVPNRLILCFDGTGNEFMGNTQDTNIVKLYNKFNLSAPHQMHYYQPGIGTYTADSSVNASWWGKVKRWFSKKIDQGLATTFDAHVIAGYRFLMRYYGDGDRIYIFGFSRGAYTARFLARMISKVGILSMGNEELVPFAYKIYQDYELGAYEGKKAPYIPNFKTTFCREEEGHKGEGSGIKVHFLGLFDTVNSVGTLDVPMTKTMKMKRVEGTAEHVRHAVAIDERRVKFKAALLQQDSDDKPDSKDPNVAKRSEDSGPLLAKNSVQSDETDSSMEDIKEVWFAGNHGDIGGGWSAYPNVDSKDEAPTENVKDDPFQLSDIALKWMIDELGKLKDHPKFGPGKGDQIIWNAGKDGFLKSYEKRRLEALSGKQHDTMKFGGGSSRMMVIFWNLMEYLPLNKRWEIVKGHWAYVTFPLNRGGTRDIPVGAHVHQTVLERMQRYPLTYRPTNAVSIPKLNKGDSLKDLTDGPAPDYQDKAVSLCRLQKHFEFHEAEKEGETEEPYPDPPSRYMIEGTYKIRGNEPLEKPHQQ